MIDGKKQKIVKCNISFIGFEVPAGNHSLALYYRSLDIKITFFISVLSGLAIVILVVSSSSIISSTNSE